ncbi:hypothetical protein [Bathymodiolus septemdierum thioautotrophic gill symbiont]|uniref:NERD domain-containing protein n=1 Tax=endosymbiont of Bathymodiolus septemdierum str. Myojin knoll TaxID=1303921 RepID=A0A0P0URY8_9GAMM|nr:hypothetical protein [Bathymodiolus septemdierum thioautotrophic gill symbiont]BAS67920.1 conserved hypothetical protein [endosymbiont of Bathymodiolus septemdierum str. Myojin knoll]
MTKNLTQGLTPSEKFINGLCESSFLKLWTHPNPKGKKNKELCDCLIVCGVHIVIISVKKIEYKDTNNKTGHDRWVKQAIDKSAKQIYGAERWLEKTDTVTRHDERIINLPPKSERIYHRISVSLGSKLQVPMPYGDLGNGFIHVCDEKSTEILFKELDTILDFTNFLQAVENLSNKTKLIFDGGGIEDLIALYLQNNDLFKNCKNSNLMISTNDIWDGWVNSQEYKDRLLDLQSSYPWDGLIEHYSQDLLSGEVFDFYNRKATNNDWAIMTMALQPRDHRAVLMDAFIECLNNDESASRIAQGYNNTIFVFLRGKHCDREHRSKELLLRCCIVSVNLENKIIVGIARDKPEGNGCSSDLVYIEDKNWTQEEKNKYKEPSKELNYFKGINWKEMKEMSL